MRRLTMSSLCQRFRDPDDALRSERRQGRHRSPRLRAVLLARGHSVLRARHGGDQAAGPFKHIGLYVHRREFLLKSPSLEPTPLERAEALEQLRVLEHGFSIKDGRNPARFDRRRYARGSGAGAPAADGGRLARREPPNDVEHSSAPGEIHLRDRRRRVVAGQRAWRRRRSARCSRATATGSRCRSSTRISTSTPGR